MRRPNPEGAPRAGPKRGAGYTTCRLERPISIAAKPLKLKYELAEGDLRAFRQYLEKESSLGRKRRWIVHAFGALSAAGVSLIVLFSGKGFVAAGLWAAIIWIGLAFWMKWFLKFADWYEERIARKLPPLRAPGHNELTIDENAVVIITASGDCSIPLSRIRSVQVSDDYVMLFITEASACLIPKRAFKTEVELPAALRFLTILMEEVQRAR